MRGSLDDQVLLSFNPLSGHRSGLQWAALRLLHSRGGVFRPCSASLALPAFHLLRPLLTSPRYSAPVARHPASVFRSTGEISRGKTRYLPCIGAEFIKHTLLPQIEDFAVTCPLVPSAPHLISGFCSSPRSFGLGAQIDPASRRRPCPSPCLRLCLPGRRTFTYEVTRHARRTREANRPARLFAQVRLSVVLGDLLNCQIDSTKRNSAASETSDCM